ncbi:MAG: hypothetical protein ACPG8A_03310 [Psychrobium sp.]
MNIDDILARAVRLARLENQGFRSFLAPSLNEALREIRRIINEAGEIESLRQLKKVETAIKKAIYSQNGFDRLTEELTDLSMIENQFMAQALAFTDKAATRELVERLARNTMLVLRQGERYNTGLWIDFIKANLDSQASAVAQIARTGYAQGWTAKEMIARAKTTLDGMITRNADALLRTGYNHFSAVGRQAFAEANKDIIEREYAVVVFDGKTSDTCISINAKYPNGWKYGSNPIGAPPYHFRCRTTLVYTPKGTGLTGTRATKTGQVKADMTINEYFKENPSIAREALGGTRYELWKSGEINLKDLTDNNLQPLTLKELAGI